MRKYLIPGKCAFLMYLLLAFGSALAGVLFGFVYSSIIDYAAAGQSNWLLFSAGIMLFITITILVETAFAIYQKYYIKRCSENLRNDLFSAVIQQDVLSFEKASPAEYLNALTVKLELYEQSYLTPILNLPLLIATLVFAVGATIMVQPILLLFLIGFGLVMFFVMKQVGGGIESAAEEHARATDTYAKRTNEYFDGFRLIFSGNIVSYVIRTHNALNAALEQTKFQKNKKQYLSIYAAQFIGITSTAAIMLAAGYLASKDLISSGIVFAVSHLIGKFVSPIESMASMKATLAGGKVLNREFREILSFPAVSYREAGKPVFEDKLVLDHISFRYPGASEDTLHDISLTLEKGKKYALVGKSGSGKTTLEKLILQYYPNYDGCITMDGRDIREWNRADLYQAVGAMPVDTFLFDDTLENNITLFSPVHADRMTQILTLSCLTEVVNALPGGSDTPIHANAKNLSAGEIARLGIARIFYRGYQLYLLDELAANLDKKTAAEVEKHILALDHATILNITHDIGEHLNLYDKVFIMKDGRIRDQGTYEEILSRNALIDLF